MANHFAPMFERKSLTAFGNEGKIFWAKVMRASSTMTMSIIEIIRYSILIPGTSKISYWIYLRFIINRLRAIGKKSP